MYARLLREEKMIPIFENYASINTGLCAVYCHHKDRGHVTDLGASTLVSSDFINKVWSRLEDTELIFTELFILKHRKNIVYRLAELAKSDNKIFGFNLPSFYFLENFLEDIKNLFEYADIVFANASEAIFLGALLGFEEEDNLANLCVKFAQLPKKNKNKKRCVVITCGPDPAYVVEYDSLTADVTFKGVYSPVNVEEEDIVDTNGAGDAFAGGFLAQYVKGKSLERCAEGGHYAASIIIKERGCQIHAEKIKNFEFK